MTSEPVSPARTAVTALGGLRRLPFTSAFLAVLLAVGLGTGGLWAPGRGRPAAHRCRHRPRLPADDEDARPAEAGSR